MDAALGQRSQVEVQLAHLAPYRTEVLVRDGDPTRSRPPRRSRCVRRRCSVRCHPWSVFPSLPLRTVGCLPAGWDPSSGRSADHIGTDRPCWPRIGPGRLRPGRNIRRVLPCALPVTVHIPRCRRSRLAGCSLQWCCNEQAAGCGQHEATASPRVFRTTRSASSYTAWG